MQHGADPRTRAIVIVWLPRSRVGACGSPDSVPTLERGNESTESDEGERLAQDARKLAEDHLSRRFNRSCVHRVRGDRSDATTAPRP